MRDISKRTCEFCGKPYPGQGIRFCSRQCWRDYKGDTNKRFWSHVDITNLMECWNWTACLGNRGYGRFRLDKRSVLSHRQAWLLVKGEIPAGLWVLHKCDNRRCVNVSHLFLGTHSDNMADMMSKGRHAEPKGELHPQAKLKDDMVLEIRAMAKQGITYSTLARKFGVSRGLIGNIVSRKRWKHI